MSRHPRRVEKALARSVAAATWLDASDEAAVVTARGLAEQLDNLLQPRQGQITADGGRSASKVGYLGQVYRAYLDGLGLTPKGRITLGIDAGPLGDELAEILQGHFTAG